jgi:GT2 family glycosyltransferase
MPESQSSLRRALRLYHSLRDWMLWRSTTLEPLIEYEESNDVRLRGDVSLKGVPHSALELVPGWTAACEVRLPSRATFVVQCGVEGAPHDRVRFAIDVDGATRERIVAPRDGWIPLRVSSGGRERARARIAVRCERLPESSGPIAPLLGSPSLRWRRTTTDLARSVSRAVRQYGVGGAVARFRARGSEAGAGGPPYREWLARHLPDAAALERMRIEADRFAQPPTFALLLVCAHGSAAESVLRTVDSLERQAYTCWEAWLWTASGEIPAAVRDLIVKEARLHVLDASAVDETQARNAVLHASPADFVASLSAGDELAPHALFELASLVSANPTADVLYADGDRLGADGPEAPTFRPGWSPEHLFARMYLGGVVAIRRSMLAAAGGYRSEALGAHDYDAVLRLSTAGARGAHAPKVLHHRGGAIVAADLRYAAERRALMHVCRLSGREADVHEGARPGIWRVRLPLTGTPRVTIVIPTDARIGPTLAGPQVLAVQCVRSIVERTSYKHFEILVVDNGTFPEAAVKALEDMPHRRISFAFNGPFNFSRIVNFGVSRTATDYVLLLNDDIEVINRDWLSAMLEYAQLPTVGAVGAKLFYPDGRLQHVGVAIGVSGVAAHLLHQHPGGSAGCGNIAVAVRNCAAVTAACMLTRRAIYDEVGGFDQRLAVDFNDVDYCLKIRAAGYRIVFTPYAKLYHHESASFGSRIQHPRDTEQMRRTWGASLDQDPYYNPNFSRAVPDCRLG